MIEEFISLLESEKSKVSAILRPRIDEKILKRLLGGFFDDEHKKFMAYSYMPIKKSMFYEYNYLFELADSGHSATYYLPETGEKTKKYLNKDTYQHKTVEELIEEGIYKGLLISYIGEFDFNEWNILRTCCFSDVDDKTRILNSNVHHVQKPLKEHFFSDPIYQETSEHYKNLMSHVSAVNKSLPVKIPAELKPFVGHSDLVAMVRTMQKAKLNLSFQDYIKKAVFAPLVVDLKTSYPNKCNTVCGFYGSDCNFLTPSHRQFCLMIFVATDKSTKSSLQFYLYHFQEDKLYNWTYLKLPTYKGILDHDLIEQIFSPISQLDDLGYINNPECNFDDNDFWENYVFKKDNGKYLYLTESNLTRPVL